jgi:hypothetical protein
MPEGKSAFKSLKSELAYRPNEKQRFDHRSGFALTQMEARVYNGRMLWHGPVS